MKKIVIASHNQGKIVEIKELLAPLGFEVLSSNDFDIAEPEENGETFIENAYIKSKAFAEATGLPALSDDSGLVVSILGGKPGIHTARWCIDESGKKDYNYGMAKLEKAVVDELAKSGFSDRYKNRSDAHFVCVLSLCLPDGTHHEFEGKVHGRLNFPGRGTGGHGYDPVFVPADHSETFAEMDLEYKNSISHRAKAFHKLLGHLKAVDKS